MADIQSINLALWTSDVSGGSTGGDVYLGLGGREFSVDSTEDDFEAGEQINYTFGESASVRFADFNDPRDQQLTSENAALQSVYLRFAPQGREDNWNLLFAVVTVNAVDRPRWTTSQFKLLDGKGIWLGVHAGLIVQMPLQSAPVLRVHEIEEAIAQVVHAG